MGGDGGNGKFSSFPAPGWMTAEAVELGMLVKHDFFFGSKKLSCKYKMHSETCMNHTCAEVVHELNTMMSAAPR